MKPGFLIYNDYRETLSMLSDDELGKLIRAIFEYEINNIVPELDKTIMMAFNFIKTDLDRNSNHYDSICERNRNNGLKGGRPRNPNNPVGILVTQQNPEKPKKAKDNVNINVNIKDKDSNNSETLEFANKYLTKWNEVFGTQYSATRQIVKPLIEWLKDHSLENILEAIENIKNDPYWKDQNVEPIWLLRFKDPKGEPVDRIEKFYNTKPVVKWQTHL